LAQQCFEQARGGYEKAGQPEDIANCLRGLGEVAFLKEDNEQGERLFAETRRLYDSVNRKPYRQGVQLQDDLRWDYWFSK